jgi:hypothetical protein
MTNHDRIEAFFDIFVRLTFGDVEREIRSARAGAPAGNFVCALALLAYTEVLGGIKRNTMARGQGTKNFDRFFAELGPDYRRVERDLQKNSGEGVYAVFRCGLAHQGFFKPEGETVATRMAPTAASSKTRTPAATSSSSSATTRTSKVPPRNSRRRSSHRQDPDSHPSSRSSSSE